MHARAVHRFESRLPPAGADDHPYRTGAWRPQVTEWDATELDVLEGAIPGDLDGVYLRNTENPLLPAIGRYHPFDGDGMLHSIHFHGGKADYRNRFVRTAGLAAELEAGKPLWAGILESPDASLRDGWGARTRMKDASSTDVVVHRGAALTTFYQCGDAYRLDPRTLEQLGPETWKGKFPRELGISAHAKVDERTGELLFFNYGKRAPYLHYGVVSAEGELVTYVPIPLPGPRLPHDMAFTERYSILNDMPLFWEEKALARNAHRVRFRPDMRTRFAVLPRHGRTEDVRWFEASPTYVLHWINAYEDGDEIVLDGFHQSCPAPEHRPGDGPMATLLRSLDLDEMKTRAHRWRFHLGTGETREEFLDDSLTEFATINPRFAGRRYRYAYAMTGEPGWFLFNGIVKHDWETRTSTRHRFPEGVFGSESPMAPRPGGTAEDDGYLVTFVTDVKADRSECQIFDARDITRGPIARVLLPERISSGTHACWASAENL